MVSDMNIFVWKLSKVAAQKKKKFFTFFGLLRFLDFFNGLFAPTSWSRMSNIFRDAESLGKSNGKKWSNIWTFLFGSGLKSPRKKSFFCWFCLGPPSYGIGATIRIGWEMLCLPYAWFFHLWCIKSGKPIVKVWASQFCLGAYLTILYFGLKEVLVKYCIGMSITLIWTRKCLAPMIWRRIRLKKPVGWEAMLQVCLLFYFFITLPLGIFFYLILEKSNKQMSFLSVSLFVWL